jgi:hypothetical protein
VVDVILAKNTFQMGLSVSYQDAVDMNVGTTASNVVSQDMETGVLQAETILTNTKAS